MLFSQLWQPLASLAIPLQAPLFDSIASASSDQMPSQFPTFAFSGKWSVLGPFQIGTREATYGPDPLELYGGFHALEYDKNATFRSSLAPNGTVSWSNFTAENPAPCADSASATVDVNFPHIPWQSIRDTYGWAAWQWQAWIRGEIYVQSEDAMLLNLYTPQVLEFWVDNVHYWGGDLFAYNRVPTTHRLAPGIHRIELRLIREVRSMGGVGEPSVQIKLELAKTEAKLQAVLQPGLGVGSGVLISDYIGNDQDAILASPHASITVRNDGDNEAIINGVGLSHDDCFGKLTSKVRVAPGQSRPISFRIKCVSPPPRFPTVDLVYSTAGSDVVRTLRLSAEPELRGIEEPHKVTFLHPGGATSYAILRPPSKAALAKIEHEGPLPVVLALHGAGLEADSDEMRHTLDDLPDIPAWTLFPTGGTSWSGDDWHVWGFADVEAAVAIIPAWIENVQWQSNGVDVSKWLVVGHSNGGQGAWYTLTHHPDKVFAAAPLSGYSSIQNYVPYTFWRPADPGRTSVLQSALLPYNHELLLSNAKAIPVFQQHGSADDNVPPYHSRLMSQLIVEAGGESQYVEYLGKPHWWDGIFTTDPLKDFIEDNLSRMNGNSIKDRSDMDDFSLVTANPGDTGPKNGIEILQLATPGQLGRLDVSYNRSTHVRTIQVSNVMALSLTSFADDDSVIVNDEEIVQRGQGITLPLTLTEENGIWQVAASPNFEISRTRRRGRQLGAMDAILRTQSAFSIVQRTNSSAASHIALQISRNLCQYFAADTEITLDYASALENSTGNIISVAIGSDLPPNLHETFPIQISEHGDQVLVRTGKHQKRYYALRDSGLAAIYLRPIPGDQRLELVVWGIDEASLAIAARMVPMMTGSGQPDFIVADATMLWKGIEGIRAMGFLDWQWEVSRNAFFV